MKRNVVGCTRQTLRNSEKKQINGANNLYKAVYYGEGNNIM
jgi:hypothetical protein